MDLFRRTPRAPAPRAPFRIHRPGTLTASAISVGVQDRRDAAKNTTPGEQHAGRIARALGYYDDVEVCWYPAQFYARAMERIRYYPAILNDAGEPEEVEDGPVAELFARIRDPGGTSMRQLAKNYGRLSFLIGDGYLIVSGDDDGEAWEYLSPLELKRQRGDEQPVKYERDNGIEKITLTEADDLEAVSGQLVRVWRLWRRHPTKSGWSDSPVFAVLNQYQKLIHLDLATSAEALSRAAQRGLLFIPDELTVETMGDDEQGLDQDPEADPLLREFIEGMTTAIQNPGSVDSMSPFILRGPGILESENGTTAVPTRQALGWEALGPQERYLEIEAAEKTIDRIALGLDMPKEMVTGTGDVNHWGGWLLDEQGFRQHVAPVVEEFCDDLAAAYLRPAAKDAGVAEFARVVIWYDPVDAIAHPDEGPAAMEAWKAGLVNREYGRNAIGATDDDAPTPEDEAFLLELLGRKKAVDPTAQDGETAPQDGGTGADTTEAPPEEPTDSAVAASGLRAAMILGAAEMQVKQARKAAGSRLRQRSRSCGECQDAIRDVPHGLVASTLGPVRVREIINGHTSEAALVAGAGGLLAEQVRDLGVRGRVPDELGQLVEAHALRTLYEMKAPPLPAGFAEIVAKALR